MVDDDDDDVARAFSKLRYKLKCGGRLLSILYCIYKRRKEDMHFNDMYKGHCRNGQRVCMLTIGEALS